MKKIIIILFALISPLLAQTINPNQVRGTAVVQTPSGSQNIAEPGGSTLNYNGSEILSKATGLAQAPLTNQTIQQPSVSGALTTLSVNSLNGVLNPTLFAGSDIGAKINTAMAALPNGCGTVQIPAGIFTQVTTIVKPRCVNLIGAGGLATVLNWTSANGFAILARDSLPAPFGFPTENAYPEGQIADLTLNGPCTRSGPGTTCTGNATAIFFGATAPDMSNYGDHQNLNRVRINLFNVGITYGNNAWSIDVNQSLINFNGTGVTFPANGGGPATNSGESLSFTNTRIQGNNVGFDLPGYGDFYFFGGSCDFNVTICGAVNIAHFFGYHFESGTGRMLNVVNSTSGNISDVGIYGGQVSLDNGTGNTSEIFFVTAIQSPTLKVTGVNIVIAPGQTLTNVVGWGGIGTNPVLSISDLSFIGGVGAFTGAVTSNCSFSGCSVNDPASGFYQYTSTSSTVKNNGNAAFTSLGASNMSGSGHALACVDASGNLFRGTATTCP